MLTRALLFSEIPDLVSFAKRTFVETYEHLNDPDDFQKYLAEHFTVARFEDEFNTEGVVFEVIEREGIEGFIKLNVRKSIVEAYQPEFYDKNAFWLGLSGGELERIYVDARAHGRGLGKMLIERAATIVKNAGGDYLWLGVWEKNEKAYAFYRRMGFEAVGQHVFVVGNDPQTDFLMLKWLR